VFLTKHHFGYKIKECEICGWTVFIVAWGHPDFYWGGVGWGVTNLLETTFADFLITSKIKKYFRLFSL
jgi:hypothetical protein